MSRFSLPVSVAAGAGVGACCTGAGAVCTGVDCVCVAGGLFRGGVFVCVAAGRVGVLVAAFVSVPAPAGALGGGSVTAGAPVPAGFVAPPFAAFGLAPFAAAALGSAWVPAPL